jgi:hypothetical protein
MGVGVGLCVRPAVQLACLRMYDGLYFLLFEWGCFDTCAHAMRHSLRIGMIPIFMLRVEFQEQAKELRPAAIANDPTSVPF